MNFKQALVQLGNLKHYLIASALVFFASMLMGAYDPGRFQFMIDFGIEAIKKIAQDAVEQPNAQLSLFWTIFLNNARAALLVIVTGAFFGIYPLFLLVMNGILLGYVSANVAQQDSLFSAVKGILPHGILELPAIIVACALGLRFGILAAKWLISFASPTRNKLVSDQFKIYFRTVVPLSILIVVTLLIAALIESTITFSLVQG
ncbi:MULTISPECIES: stage II sporulation protein M [unclassified Paenibacillus]|uniref:stage II sporulation protein M n=1 Tax=unclassified Paenibacillus TaxID=185978 RepID=UPI0006D23379|nr:MULTISPECIES: stage II sporulation protein M [unclassified Paenibacillus]